MFLAICPLEQPFAQTTDTIHFCCPTTIFVQPVVGQSQINECVIDPDFNLPITDLPPVIQCPIQFPFSKNVVNSHYIESCCQCPSQTKCIPAGESNYFNEIGAEAMMKENGFIDESKLVAVFYLCKLICLCPISPESIWCI